MPLTTETRDLLRIEAYDYDLPEERIAQQPLEERDQAKLLHVEPSGTLFDAEFTDLPSLLSPGDLLVVNETTVRKARLAAMNGERTVELFVVEVRGENQAVCLVRPGKHVREGDRLLLSDGTSCIISSRAPHHPGARLVTFDLPADSSLDALIEKNGEMPLPPYIRDRNHDTSYYQTVYAQGPPASVAAPTAGLHFTPLLLETLRARGIGIATINLTVGMGTFLPMRGEHIDEHVMHEEEYVFSEEASDAVRETRERGGRVIAVGTTSARVLETVGATESVAPASGKTRLYITPGFQFHVVDGLVTNFHQPKSTLAVLVAGFIGYDRWRHSYTHALSGSYRFLSYGDAMLCWRQGG